MLTAFVAIVNAIGWIIYYIASGGYFETTETAQVRLFTIITIIIASVASAVIGYVLRGACDGLFSNILNNVFGTALCTTPFIFCFYGKLDWSERIWGFILFAIVFFIYIGLFCTQMDFSLLVRFIGFAFLLVIVAGFSDTHIAEYGLGSGIVIGGIPSLINGIYNYIEHNEF